MVHRERTEIIRDIGHREHVYVDRHDQVYRHTAWPSYHFRLHYDWGPWRTYSYCYPYYHRRYVFVSLAGWWPYSYRHRRYYWYGYHPYRWYGYYPVAREVEGDTYNYYTYHYYDDDDGGADTYTTAYVGDVDHTTFADVRERLAEEQAEEPDEMTLADQYFEDAVKAFESGAYELAAELFAKAMALAPDDVILPFAYSQALFSARKYNEAAEVLRAALANVSPEKEGIFYPRGLYAKDETLFDQLEQLAEKAQLYGFDGDLQLLLGYHLLGIGEFDDALEPLRLASEDVENASSAAVLLGLLEKMRAKDPADIDTTNTWLEQE